MPNETKYVEYGFCRRFRSQSLFKQFHTCNSIAASAGGLGGTLTFTHVVMCEEDLRYDPAHRRPLMTLIQIGLWGIFQHLRWRTGAIGTTGRTDVTGRTSTTVTTETAGRTGRKRHED